MITCPSSRQDFESLGFPWYQLAFAIKHFQFQLVLEMKFKTTSLLSRINLLVKSILPIWSLHNCQNVSLKAFWESKKKISTTACRWNNGKTSVAPVNSLHYRRKKWFKNPAAEYTLTRLGKTLFVRNIFSGKSGGKYFSDQFLLCILILTTFHQQTREELYSKHSADPICFQAQYRNVRD